MPRRADRLHSLLAAVRRLLPAGLMYLVAAALDHPLALLPLLIANTLAMKAFCRNASRMDESDLAPGSFRSAIAHGVLSAAYVSLVAAALVPPVAWLAGSGSLTAALAVSAAASLALFVAWRWWPLLALPFLWRDAWVPQPHLGAALRRSFILARELVHEHDRYFRDGLPVALGLLLLAAGALLLSGIGLHLPAPARQGAFAAYVLVLMPSAHLFLINRCRHALLAHARHARRQRPQEQPRPSEFDDAPVALPSDIGRAELDATLLHAVHGAQVDLALAVLERGADANALPGPELRDQRSPLMVAVTLPDLRLLRALIAAGADVDRAHGGITPLIAATRDSYQGRPEAVTTLLANGADARAPDAAGDTPLHHAARCAEPIIAALLLDAEADIDAVNAAGQTALGIACHGANWRVAEFLLERGARPERDAAVPALLLAASVAEDDPTGVKLLLRRRAHVDARAALERTPLMAAALAGHVRIVDALLAAGASVDLADHRGTTALMEAARAGAVAVIHRLGKRKADPDRVDAGARTALMIACQSRHAGEETVRALLALGADRTLVGRDGKRALDHAAGAGRWPIVALLDPAYPLPSSLADAPQSASADHLLDALRFGHWDVAAGFSGHMHDWPPAALADLYLELADAEHTRARHWLLNHGLAGDPQLSDGRALIEVLTTRLPGTAAALAELVARGAPVGGAGLVARVLALAARGSDGLPLRLLAHELLERGADWGGRTSGQRSALHLAVALGDLRLAAALLERGADPNARDAHGRTPLHLALQADGTATLALLKALLRAGASPEIATATGETPLGLALAREQPELAWWLSWSPWPLPPRRLRDADLPAAAAAGDIDAVERLLALGLPLDAVDAQGATALIRAAGCGHAALVVRLLDLGADTTRAAHSGIHCLAAAVGARREAIVRTLLSYDVAADLPLPGGGTALTLAAALGQVRIAEALLEAGADPNAADQHGSTPLHATAQYAFDSGNAATSRALFELLLRAGACLDACNRTGQDPLLILLGARAQPGARCDAEHLRALLELVLRHGARLDAQDQRGVGALHACALHGLLGCARLLKAHGAPLDLVDGFGRSAADVAALLGYSDVAGELGAHAAPLPGVRQTLRQPARAPE
ncbi:MAG: hypothetical protein GXC76_16795 [Rhodanobacteraceae bacterium]|nr:hypothetical protein [Rhodanobacteraceae bacterium]